MRVHNPIRWPRREARFWEAAPFFRLVVPLVAGIAVYDRIGPVPLRAPWLWGSGLVALSALILLLAVRRHTGLYRGARVAAFAALFLILGIAAASVKDVRNSARWIGTVLQPAGAAVLRVEGPPKGGERIWTVRAQVLAQLCDGRATPASGTVLLNVYKRGDAVPVAAGDTLVVRNDWQPVTDTRNPFGFGYQAFCRRQNLFHQQFLDADQLFVAGHAQPSDLALTYRIHTAALATLRRYVTDTATRGILEAMLVGYEGDFSPELRQAYSETGVVHIVAISGSHVATLFLLFWWVPRVVRGKKGRWLQYALGLTAVWLYVLVAGAPPSAVRSAVVFTFLTASVLSGRAQQTLNTLLASMFFLLCVQPMWLFSVGFQLSVAAVLSLLLFYPHIRVWWTPAWRPARLLWEAGAASIAAQLLVTPLSIYYFHNFPLWFFLANLFAWLLLGMLGLVGGLLLLLFAWWPAVAGGIAAAMTVLVTGFNAIVGFFQRWNPASFRALQLSGPELLLLYGSVAGFAVFLLTWQRRGFWIGGGALCGLLALLCVDAWRAAHNDRLLVYAVSRHTVAEHLRGRRYHPVFSDTAADGLRAPREARTGYGAWRKGPSEAAGVKRISGKTVLVLSGAETRFAAGQRFPVDVLLVARSLKGLSAAHLKETFAPGVLVVGGAEKRWLVDAWADSCRRIGQPFWATRLHGAFVLE